MSALKNCFAVMMCSVILALGCSSAPKADGKQHAECLVCKYNADLGCVDVTVEPDTPTTLYQGKNYYFCSNKCRRLFTEEPAKYVNQK